MTTLQSQIRFPEEVLFRELSGEAVILNTLTGKYYSLDEVGTRMWQLLAEHGSLYLAYQALLVEYDVTEEQLSSDLLKLVDELAEHELVVVDDK